MDPEKQQNLYPPVYNHNTMPSPLQSNNEQQLPYPSAGPPSYDQQQPQPVVVSPVVVTQQPAPNGATTTVILQTQAVGRNPQAMTCPNCKALITTNVKNILVPKTHIFAGLICLCGGWLGCCLIPYCVDSCQGQEHTCPNCGNFVGVYK